MKESTVLYWISHLSCDILHLLLVVLIVVVSSILWYRTAYHISQSTTICNDNNDCTEDYLYIKSGKESYCTFEKKLNGESCTSLCSLNNTCQTGTCVGVCLGLCSVIADCPDININYTDFNYTKICLISICNYVVDIHIYNVSLLPILTFYRVYTNVGNYSENSSFIGGFVNGSVYTLELSTLETYYYTPLVNMCLGFLNDSTCMTSNIPAISMYPSNETIIQCKYSYTCTSIHNFPGSILI